MHHDHHHDDSAAKRSAAFTGLGLALVWLAIVSAVGFWLANRH